MRDKLTRPHCRIELLPPLGSLSVPILKDLLHDPSGGRPDEALLRGQFPRLLHHLERPIDHRRAVVSQQILDSMTITEIEMRLADHDNLPDAAGIRACSRIFAQLRPHSKAERWRSGK